MNSNLQTLNNKWSLTLSNRLLGTVRIPGAARLFVSVCLSVSMSVAREPSAAASSLPSLLSLVVAPLRRLGRWRCPSFFVGMLSA